MLSNSYPTNFGQIPVLVIFVLKFLLLKNLNLLLDSGVSKQQIFWKPLKCYF